jgi:transcriptional regulator with XRE-family HTH domain
MSIAHDPTLRIPPSTLSVRLQQSREWRGLNQIELAEALDVSRGTISNYERGVSTPSRLQVNAWAAFCDVDVEWLKDGLQPQEAPDGGGLTGKLRTDNSRRRGELISMVRVAAAAA